MKTEGPRTRRTVRPQALSVRRRRLRRLLVAAMEHYTRDVVKDASTSPASERVSEKNRCTGRARNKDGEVPTRKLSFLTEHHLQISCFGTNYDVLWFVICYFSDIFV